MCRKSLMIILLGIIMSYSLIQNDLIGVESKSGDKNEFNGWIEDCVDISDWIDAADTPFESQWREDGASVINLSHSLVSQGGKFTPDELWWNDTINQGDGYIGAAAYRQLPEIQTNDWILETFLDFDPYSPSIPETFRGDMQLLITGSNLEVLFVLQLRDGSGSFNNHEAWHRAFYVDNEDSLQELVPQTFASGSTNFTDQQMSIHVTGSTFSYYTPITQEWIDTSESASTIFQRGTPTYIVLFAERSGNIPSPSALAWKNITVAVDSQDGWNEDCEDLSDWIDASEIMLECPWRDDGAPYHNITHSIASKNGTFTPNELWWNDTIDQGEHDIGAAIYRDLPNIQMMDWEFNTIIDFNPYSPSIPENFRGDMQLFIIGSNFEVLFVLQLRDGSGSIGSHNVWHRAYYFDSDGNFMELVPQTFASGSSNFTDQHLSIRVIGSTFSYFTPISQEWIDTSESFSTIFQRGIPTYVVLFAERSGNYPAPSALTWKNISLSIYEPSIDDFFRFTTFLEGSFVILALLTSKIFIFSKRKEN